MLPLLERKTTVKVMVFWDVMVCSLVYRYQCYGGTHFQSRSVGTYLPNYNALQPIRS